MNLLNRLLHLVAPAAHTTKSSMAAVAFDDIEHSVRTGDLLLFSDASLLSLVDQQTRAHQHCAMLATRTLSRLPCLSATSVYWSSGADDAQLISEEGAGGDDDQLFTPRAANRTVLPTEWLNWQHVALIVCVDSDQGATRPFVFIANGEGQFALRPMRQIVTAQASATGARTFFAVRHLIINHEEQLEPTYADASLRRFVSQRRGHLRDKIVAFHRGLLQQVRQHPDPLNRHQHIMRVMVGPAPAEMRTAEQMQRDALLLMRSSISFTTLCTLYAAQVLRIEPRAIDAAQLLQQHHVLQHHLAADYQFSDECLFVVEKQQQK